MDEIDHATKRRIERANRKFKLVMSEMESHNSLDFPLHYFPLGDAMYFYSDHRVNIEGKLGFVAGVWTGKFERVECFKRRKDAIKTCLAWFRAAGGKWPSETEPQ